MPSNFSDIFHFALSQGLADFLRSWFLRRQKDCSWFPFLVPSTKHNRISLFRHQQIFLQKSSGGFRVIWFTLGSNNVHIMWKLGYGCQLALGQFLCQHRSPEPVLLLYSLCYCHKKKFSKKNIVIIKRVWCFIDLGQFRTHFRGPGSHKRGLGDPSQHR